MGFLELGYRGAIVFDNSDVKIEQAPESPPGFVKQKFLGLSHISCFNVDLK